jgi:hypothetical protein
VEDKNINQEEEMNEDEKEEQKGRVEPSTFTSQR